MDPPPPRSTLTDTLFPYTLVCRSIRTRQFVLNMGMGGMMARGGAFTINGKSMDMPRIDEVVRIGTSEIWEISNVSMMAHPFHVHDGQFRILDRHGLPPSVGEQGLKAVVVVAPRESVRILLRFADFADPNLPYNIGRASCRERVCKYM